MAMPTIIAGVYLRCLKSRSVLEITRFTTATISARGFARRVKPLSVTSPHLNVDDDNEAYFERMDRNVWEEIKRNEDDDLEPSIKDLDTAYDEYEQEHQTLKEKAKKMKMIRKHFQPFIAKEVNLLTYAEKEKIRFLHKSDPEKWNPEALSRSFPISKEGAGNVVRSKFQLDSFEEIRNHDEQVIDRLNRIRKGEIPLTEQLKTKLRIRNQIPIQPGIGLISTLNLTVPRKPLGEFGKLVAMSKQLNDLNGPDSDSPPPTIHKKALKPFPLHETLSEEENQLEQEQQRGQLERKNLGRKQKQIDENNEFRYKGQEKIDENKELRQMKINPNHTMTLSEFEGEVKSSHKRTGKKQTPEVDYLLQVKEKVALVDLLKEDDNFESEPVEPSIDDYVNFGKLQKFKKFPSSEEMKLNVQRGLPYIYDPKTGYQKPYANATVNDPIKIPMDKQKSDTTYRIGDSYYDSNGEFLYRVI